MEIEMETENTTYFLPMVYLYGHVFMTFPV